MKSILQSLVLVSMVCMASAQQPPKRHTMMISVYESYSVLPHSTRNILVTKEDGTQEMTVTKTKPTNYSLKNFQEEEDSVFAMLKPYFDQGWKLSASNTVPVSSFSGGGNMSVTNDLLTRYFLYKEDAE